MASKNNLAQKSPLMDQRVVQAIETQLDDSGLSTDGQRGVVVLSRTQTDPEFLES